MDSTGSRFAAAISAAYQSQTARDRYAKGHHAPRGGITIGGKKFAGGEFIPGNVVSAATPEQKAKLEPTREGFEAIRQGSVVPEGKPVVVGGKTYGPGDWLPSGAVSKVERSGKGSDKKALKESLGDRELSRAFFDADGKELHPGLAEFLQTVQSGKSKLTPELSDIQISTDPKSDIWAFGRKPNGKITYIYSPEFQERKAAEKWARNAKFAAEGGPLEKLRAQVQEEIDGEDGDDREAAMVLRFLDLAAIRIDSSEGRASGKVRAYGASSLEAQHVTIDGDRINYSFIGKEGIENFGSIDDAQLAEALKPRVAAGGRLFRTNYKKVTDYFKRTVGKKYLIKDIRTANATESALEAIAEMVTPTTENEYNERRRAVGVKVAERIHHVSKIDKKTGARVYSPGMALDNYIPPEVFAPWQSAVGTFRPEEPDSTTSSSKASSTPARKKKAKKTPTGGTPKKPAATPTTTSESTSTKKPATKPKKKKASRKKADVSSTENAVATVASRLKRKPAD